MSLRTVRAPAELAPIFERAEEVVSRYFACRVDDPAHGSIEICGERYVLIRAAALSVEFFSLVRSLYGRGREAEADEFARSILFDLAHTVGKGDARSFHAKMDLRDPVTRLSAGPVHFAHAGWASVEIDPSSRPVASEEFRLVYDHPYSFESGAWTDAGERPAFPVCVMNAGYSSGWCEESFGMTLVSAEILCRARGDAVCRFVMAPPDRIAALADEQRAPGDASHARIPDFFARKRIEEQLRCSRDELDLRVRERTAELERSNGLLRAEMARREAAERMLLQAQKLEAVGLLAGGVAHDFNNLLGIILTRSSLVQVRCGRADPLWREMEQIRASCRRAAALTRQLLAFSRGQEVERRSLDLNAIVGDLGKTLVPLVGEHIDVTIAAGPDVPPVEADAGQIEQVLMNLVVNARDAMPAGGRLAVETRRELIAAPTPVRTGELRPGVYAVLSVADTGTGMDDDTVSKIFDPFFTTKPEGRGTGLGLSTVYGVVRQAGGAIEVASAPGRGTTFRVFLPAGGAAPAERCASVEDAPLVPAPGRRVILLVEDEESLRQIIGEALTDAGYHVCPAECPAAALGILDARSGEVDLLLSDMVLPEMSGRVLAEAVRHRTPHVRVLLMSGYDPDRGAEDEASDGAPVLQKPFSVEQLTHRVREVLARPAGGDPLANG
jgi:two-component system, cell cycle sensor histidine kinase and response regulator CckA